eukprot:scaffold8877_cov112-Isochrysis_galbana.AAC.8
MNGASRRRVNGSAVRRPSSRAHRAMRVGPSISSSPTLRSLGTPAWRQQAMPPKRRVSLHASVVGLRPLLRIVPL